MTPFYCPFLTCLKRGPHTHEACESCGAVRHGSLNCLECLRWNKRLARSPVHAAWLRTIIKIRERLGPMP